MALQIRFIPLASGQEIPVLVRDGLQVYETTWWLVDALLPSQRGMAPNTLLAKLRAVAHWLQWAAEHSFDWAAAVQSGRFMSPAVIRQVLEWCETEVHLVGENPGQRLRVNSTTAGARAGFQYQFLEWYADRLARSLPQSGFRKVVMEGLDDWRSQWKTLAGKMFPHDQYVRPPEAMDDAVRTLFLRVIRPKDPGNPWVPAQQVRNYALLMLLYEHGLRVSDVLQLRMDDLRLEKGWFTISERVADPHETRKRRPNPKRRGATVRTLRFTDTSLAAMQEWLNERSKRALWPGATRSPFVFVSHWANTSRPLAVRRPGQLFADLRAAHPEKRGKNGQLVAVGFDRQYFHPHAMRHDRAVRFVLEYDRVYGWDLRGVQAMREVFGWSLRSIQPQYYARAAFLKIGTEAMVEVTDRRTRMGLARNSEDAK